MEESNNEVLYLKEVTLSGYKSIKDINIRFQKGLNIIIGKNAAGKTNFIEFLNKNLQLEFDGLNNFSSNLIFENGKEISVSASKNAKISDLMSASPNSWNVQTKLTVDNKEIEYDRNSVHQLNSKISEQNALSSCCLINHGVPKKYLIVDEPIKFHLGKKMFDDELSAMIRDTKTQYFLRKIAISLIIEPQIDSIKPTIYSSVSKIKSYLELFF